jgi:hypothetical protein
MRPVAIHAGGGALVALLQKKMAVHGGPVPVHLIHADVRIEPLHELRVRMAAAADLGSPGARGNSHAHVSDTLIFRRRVPTVAPGAGQTRRAMDALHVGKRRFRQTRVRELEVAGRASSCGELILPQHRGGPGETGPQRQDQ